MALYSNNVLRSGLGTAYYDPVAEQMRQREREIQELMTRRAQQHLGIDMARPEPAETPPVTLLLET